MPAFAAVRKFGGARLRANDDLERRGGRASIRPATPQPQRCDSRSSSKTRSAKSIAGAQTAAVQKINGARISEITLQDVEELLSVVDPTFAHTGTIQKGEVKIFLQEVLAFTCSDTEIETLHSFIDTDDDGNLTAEEFHQALTDRPVQQYMRMLQSEQRVRRRFSQVTGQYSSISRDFLLQHVRKRVQRDDAFQTLPFTICYVLVFLLLVDSHLQILTRHKVRRSLEGWMSNFGSDLAGPFLAESVVSVDSMGRWLETSGMGAIFGECKPNRNGKPWCHLADRNILIGDVELTQYRRDGTTPSEWLLRESAEASVRDQSTTASLLDASRERVRHLWDSGWVDSSTQEIRISFTSYNRRRRMFAVTQVTAIVRQGFVVTGVKTAAIDVDPYRRGYLLIALDVLFGGFLIFSLQQEVRDLFMTCRLQGAASGLATYMGFWNAVDWLSIAIGTTSAAVWALCCSAAQGPAISSLLGGDVRSAVLDPDVMSLDEANLRELKAELCRAVGLYFCLQLLLAALVASIMLKFFKAFHANLRLQLVTGTLSRASDDMFHWGIVFTVVFAAFALIGHLVFGGDLVQFGSFSASLHTAFRTLMGEFNWYVETVDSEVGLKSGVPVFLLGAWFWIFMVVVTLVMLNMLLAVILEHYATLVHEVRAQEVPSIFSQAWEYVEHRVQERGFVPLSRVLVLLEDEHENVHPEERVSADSLARAFGMAEEQANFVMAWLLDESMCLQRRVGYDDGETVVSARIEATEAFLSSLFTEVQSLCTDVYALTSSLDLPKQVALRSCWSGNLSSSTASLPTVASEPTMAEEPKSAWGGAVKSGLTAEQPRDVPSMASDLRSLASRIQPLLADVQPVPIAVVAQSSSSPSSSAWSCRRAAPRRAPMPPCLGPFGLCP